MPANDQLPPADAGPVDCLVRRPALTDALRLLAAAAEGECKCENNPDWRADCRAVCQTRFARDELNFLTDFASAAASHLTPNVEVSR